MLWHKNMECGIPTVDQEHKELFAQVDRLLKAGDQSRAVETLNFLGKYVIRHFANEEEMHIVTGYPRAKEHEKLHRDFTSALMQLRKEYEDSGHSLIALLKINRIAVSWLQEHVLGADMDFADYQRQGVPAF